MIYQLKHVAVFGSVIIRGVFVRCVCVCVCLCWCLCLSNKRNWFKHFQLIAFCAKTALVHRTHTNTTTLRNVGISWEALQCMIRTGFVHNSIRREIRSWVSKRLRALTILWLYGTHYWIMWTVLIISQHLQLPPQHNAAQQVLRIVQEMYTYSSSLYWTRQS